MEVFFGSTPTYSGNYKANLETFPDEYASDTPDRFLSVRPRASTISERSGVRLYGSWLAVYRMSRAATLWPGLWR